MTRRSIQRAGLGMSRRASMCLDPLGPELQAPLRRFPKRTRGCRRANLCLDPLGPEQLAPLRHHPTLTGSLYLDTLCPEQLTQQEKDSLRLDTLCPERLILHPTLGEKIRL